MNLTGVRSLHAWWCIMESNKGSLKADLRRDYKHTLEAWKDALAKKDTKLMSELSTELIRFADAMERVE